MRHGLTRIDTEEIKVPMEFYPEPFDTNKPPPATPNRDMWSWPILGWIETKESKKRTAEYRMRKRKNPENHADNLFYLGQV
jgi:hypothetical protein